MQLRTPELPLGSLRIGQSVCMSDYAEGDRVQVLAGPFSGFKGTVLEAEPGRAIVLINVFARDTPVALEADLLRRDDDEGDGGAGVREPRNPLGPLDDLHVEVEEVAD